MVPSKKAANVRLSLPSTNRPAEPTTHSRAFRLTGPTAPLSLGRGYSRSVSRRWVHRGFIAAAALACVVSATGTAEAVGAPFASRATPALPAATAPPAWKNWPVTFYFGMRRADPAASGRLVQLATRGDARFRQWLTPAQVASTFGAPLANQEAVREWFSDRGFATTFDATASFAQVTGPARLWESTFGLPLIALSHDTTFDIPGTLITWKSASPRLPAALLASLNAGELVWEYSTSQALPSTTAVRGDLRPPRNGGTWVGKCRQAQNLESWRGTYSFEQVVHAYGFAPIRRAARDGQGVSVGLITPGEGVNEPSTRVAEGCWGWPRRDTRIVLGSGQTTPAPLIYSGFHEPSLDSQMIRGFLPRASLVNYQVWTDQDVWFLALAAVAADPARPSLVSLSYAYCLTADVRTSLFDALSTRLGLIGTTTIAASGDGGAYPCAGRKPSVQWPASSPAVLGVGGTRLSVNPANNRVGEVAWNDFAWLSADQAGGATGGGFSSNYARPSWQRAPGLAPGSGRGVPDIAAHASRLPGWPVVVRVGRQSVWSRESGTSAAAPLIAAELAAINSVNAGRGSRRIGFVNPELYRLARLDSGVFFFDVVAGNNGVPRVGGGFSGQAGYDPVTGLGVPNPTTLAVGLR